MISIILITLKYGVERLNCRPKENNTTALF